MPEASLIEDLPEVHGPARLRIDLDD